MRYLLGQKPKPSIKVAERLGERLEGETEVGDMHMLVYGVDNSSRKDSR